VIDFDPENSKMFQYLSGVYSYFNVMFRAFVRSFLGLFLGYFHLKTNGNYVQFGVKAEA